MFNCRVLVKYNTVVILNASVLLVGHLYLTVRKSINLVFDEEIVVIVSLIVEESCLYLGTRCINQFYVQQATIAALVFPCLFLMLLCYSCFDPPIKQKSVQRFYWSVGFARFELIHKV